MYIYIYIHKRIYFFNRPSATLSKIREFYKNWQNLTFLFCWRAIRKKKFYCYNSEVLAFGCAFDLLFTFEKRLHFGEID